MSIIQLPAQLSSDSNPQADLPIEREVQDALPQPGEQTVRRRGSLEQARALKTLGHAVEYLVDSRLFCTGEHNQQDVQEAVRILMRMSRAIFAECPEVISLKRRLGLWVADTFAGEGIVQVRG